MEMTNRSFKNCFVHAAEVAALIEEAAKKIDSLKHKIDVLQTELEVCGPPGVIENSKAV